MRLTDRNGVALPAELLGLVPRQRVTGEKYLVHVVPQEITLRPGDELHMRRVAADDDAGELDGCTHVLQVVRHRGQWEPTKAERAEAVRLDGLAFRQRQEQAT